MKPSRISRNVRHAEAAKHACHAPVTESEKRTAAAFLGLSRYLPEPQAELPLIAQVERGQGQRNDKGE